MTAIPKRPGAYYRLAMHAGEDAVRVFILYSSYDKATKTGTPVDLSGCAFAAQGKDADGVSVWLVTPTFVTDGTDGKIELVVPAATTTTKKGESGEYAIRVTYPSGRKIYEVWGDYSISSTVLVD